MNNNNQVNNQNINQVNNTNTGMYYQNNNVVYPPVNNVQPQTQPQTQTQPVNYQPISPNQEIKPPEKKSNSVVYLLIFIIVLLGGTLFFISSSNSKVIENLKYSCSPVYETEKTELDVNSTLVQELYSKVKTTSKEDFASNTFDDEYKLYLAYRQILESEKYVSNCSLYDNNKKEYYSCVESKDFVPRAFKKDVLVREYKRLFGEDSSFNLNDISLGYSCFGGFQYISSRDEYVEGECSIRKNSSYEVAKELKKATSTSNVVVLEEEVNYYENEKTDVPKHLRSGKYTYTFKLDMNYNYVLVDRTFEPKY